MHGMSMLAMLSLATAVAAGRPVVVDDSKDLPVPRLIPLPGGGHAEVNKSLREIQAKMDREPVCTPEESQSIFAANVRERAAKVEHEIGRDEAVVRAWLYVRREIPTDAEASAEYLPAAMDAWPYIGLVRAEAAAWKVRLCSRVFECALERPNQKAEPAPIVTVWLHAQTGQLVRLTLEKPTLNRATIREWQGEEGVRQLAKVDRERWIDFPGSCTYPFLEALAFAPAVGASAGDAERIVVHLIRRRTIRYGEQNVWACEFIGISPHVLGHGPVESQRYLRHVIDADTGESDWSGSSPGIPPDPRKNSVARPKMLGERTWPDRDGLANKNARNRDASGQVISEPKR